MNNCVFFFEYIHVFGGFPTFRIHILVCADILETIRTYTYPLKMEISAEKERNYYCSPTCFRGIVDTVPQRLNIWNRIC